MNITVSLPGLIFTIFLIDLITAPVQFRIIKQYILKTRPYSWQCGWNGECTFVATAKTGNQLHYRMGEHIRLHVEGKI